MYQSMLWESARTTKHLDVSSRLIKTLEKEVDAQKFKKIWNNCETPKLVKHDLIYSTNKYSKF